MKKIGTTAIAVVVFALLGPAGSFARPADLGEWVGRTSLTAATPPSAAKPLKQVKQAKQAKHATTKKKPGQSVKYRPDARDSQGSRETEGQRNDRLSRECRGAVNAGACAGYTR